MYLSGLGHTGDFKWSEYLRQPGPVPAPAYLFTEVYTYYVTLYSCISLQYVYTCSGLKLNSIHTCIPVVHISGVICSIRDSTMVHHPPSYHPALFHRSLLLH